MAGVNGNLDSLSLRALQALAAGARSKSRLAAETYGEDNASTRSLISRLSKKLIEQGWVQEQKSGRERLVEITTAGREQLRRAQALGRSSPVPAPPTLEATLDSLRTKDPKQLHPYDRPRFHLRHASLLAYLKLRQRGMRSDEDEFYSEMLLTLAHDAPDNTVLADRKAFDSYASVWKREPRKHLIEALVGFQDPEHRRHSAGEFMALVEGRTELEGAEAVLWASGAIDVAHQYFFAPASPLDRLTARRLLSEARQRVEPLKSDPSLTVAAHYRLGKVSKVAAVGWGWNPEAPASLCEAGGQGSPLEDTLQALDYEVVQAARFNGKLEAFERALMTYLGRWIMLAIPSSEWVFRRAGGIGLALEIAEWAKEMHDRGTLTELLVSRVQSEPGLQHELREFVTVSREFENGYGMWIKPYVEQAKALLGESIETPPTPDKSYYKNMLLNNLWKPEMVAAHTVAAAAVGE